VVKLLFISLLLSLLLPLSACLSTATVLEEPVTFKSTDNSPKRVVIMPFYNRTEKEGLEVTVRESFYNHFSSKNFHDVELHEIDGSIQALEKLYSKPWQDISALELGNFFNADFIIYGDVKIFNKMYLLLYSQMALQLEVTMIDVISGNVCFSKTVEKTLRCGDIPLSPLSVFSVAFRSGLNIKESRIIDLADKVSRAFAESIPEPASSTEEFWGVTIQIASFAEKERALQTIKELNKKGFALRMEEVVFNNKTWYRIMGGPYLETTAREIKETIADGKRFHPIVIHTSSAES
jgi:hypothetical protein